MKRTINFLKKSLFVVIILSVFACSNEKDIKQTKSDINVGELHNECLIGVFSTAQTRFINDDSPLRGDLRNVKAFITDKFYNISYDPTPIGLTHNEFMEKTIQLTNELSLADFDIRKMENKYLSENSYLYIERLLNETLETTNLNEIYQIIDVIEKEAKNNLSDDDFITISECFSVAKSSAYLWAPESEGGYDLLTKTFGQDFISTRAKSSNLKWWQKAFIGDVSGSASYFLGLAATGAISAAAVPGANAVLFVGWGVSAAYSSAMGAII